MRKTIGEERDENERKIAALKEKIAEITLELSLANERIAGLKRDIAELEGLFDPASQDRQRKTQ